MILASVEDVANSLSDRKLQGEKSQREGEREGEREKQNKKWVKIGSGSKKEKCHPEGKKKWGKKQMTMLKNACLNLPSNFI